MPSLATGELQVVLSELLIQFSYWLGIATDMSDQVQKLLFKFFKGFVV